MSRRDTANLVVAFVLAVVAWSSIRLGGDNQLNIQVPLEVSSIPSGLIVTEKLRETAMVTLRGSRGGLSRLRQDDLAIELDLSGRAEGDANLELDGTNVKGLPVGVAVVGVAPPVVSVKLEALLEALVPVREQLAGPVPDGFRVKVVEIRPSQVLFKGPARIGKKLKEVQTEPVEINALIRSPDREAGIVASPEAFQYLSPRRVNVRAEVTEETIEKKLLLPVRISHRDGHNVQVTPDVVSVTISGPASLVRGLGAASLQAEVDFSPYPPGRYRRVSPKVRMEGPGPLTGLEISYTPKQFDIVVTAGR
ncbi:MAG: hypothetical protein KIT79_05430 [Deltaproteobacteria bacterium]|nr:hypothetical protein [Deltaproteobacteria bacterium]